MKRFFVSGFLVLTSLFSVNLKADVCTNNADQVTKHLDIANSLAHQGNTNAALNEIDQALAINPCNPRAFKTRANIHYSMGNYQLALEDANQFVKLAPDVALAYIDRAILHYTLGNTLAAKEDIDYALELQPDSEFAKNVRSHIYSADKPVKKAPFKTN